ncbi:MAG: cohesin domain-containing protein [Planctomycetota bacterium]
MNAFTFLAASAVALCASSVFGQVLSVNASPLNSSAGSALSREFTVDVNIAGMTGAVGAQATVAFDPAVVSFVGVAAGTDFTTLIYSSTATANKVVFATGIDPSASAAGIAAGNVAKLTFRTIAPSCSDLDAVILSTSALTTRITDSNGVALGFTQADNVSITSLAPFTLAAVPANAAVAADAGTLSGALVTLVAPTATNSCGTPLTVTATRSDSLALSAYYPPNATTTVHYAATDAAGNTNSSDVTVTVANYQLLDAAISLNGSITGNSTRSVRITAGSTQLVNVAMTTGSGTASNVQVPIAVSYPCIKAKDVGHSLSNTGASSLVGVEYAASIALDQGDSNDDNLVDILDFGIYVGKFGAALAGGSSNFNDDTAVNSGDFSFISLNFAHSGTVCGAFTGGAPRNSVSVKELRRSGMGELAGADFNRDGMLDVNDVVYYMQNGIHQPAKPIVTTQW